MGKLQFLFEEKIELGSIKRGVIIEIMASGSILVNLNEIPGHKIICDYLMTSKRDNLVLHEGDHVLVMTPDYPDGNGCVLGLTGTYQKPDSKRLVLEADEELAIQCGKGSIMIRKDGKILVKGLEIVSHAKAANRIRGGSVQLN